MHFLDAANRHLLCNVDFAIADDIPAIAKLTLLSIDDDMLHREVKRFKKHRIIYLEICQSFHCHCNILAPRPCFASGNYFRALLLSGFDATVYPCNFRWIFASNCVPEDWLRTDNRVINLFHSSTADPRNPRIIPGVQRLLRFATSDSQHRSKKREKSAPGRLKNTPRCLITETVVTAE